MTKRCITTILFISSFGFLHSCLPRDYGYGSVVCVCNISHCDQLGPVNRPSNGTATLYESSKEGARFIQKNMNFTSLPDESWLQLTINIDRSEKYQTILGFGGAFTDAAAINILSLPEHMQDQILQGYYSADGLDYTFGRIPMASCDFSTHVYSYDDSPGDFNLTHFNLTLEDIALKIPLIKRAQANSSEPIKLFASPWSAPGWMKNTGRMSTSGWLKGKVGGIYYQTWADYFVRFLQEYRKYGIEFWGITAQNEPITGYIPFYSFQTMGFTPNSQREFIKKNLGPTLKRHGFGADKLNLMIMDDQRFLLPYWAYTVLNDNEVAEYVAGTAFHWYLNFISPPVLLDITHNFYPDKFLLATEACEGSQQIFDPHHVKLGSWDRAESYAHDILTDLLHWTGGWVDWNLALNTKGGPNWAKNFVDSPIIVNSTAKEFYKQPMYYALAHFSKFLPNGTVRINTLTKWSVSKWLLEIGAFERPDGGTVLIVINRSSFSVSYTVNDEDTGYLQNKIPSHSIHSYIW